MGKKPRHRKTRSKDPWDEKSKNFLISNYLVMTDSQVGRKIGRTAKSVAQMRGRLQLFKVKEGDTQVEDRFKVSHVANLSEPDKKDFLIAELRRTSQYKKTKSVLTKEELTFYEERYIEFMSDPTVETMTSAEKDTLHRKTLTEVRLFRFMEDERRMREMIEEDEDEDEKDSLEERERNVKYLADRSRQIQDCQQVIKECEKSLNVTREQRLKNSSDQAINFTSIVKDLQNPTVRIEAGYEAAIFRWMARRHYNDKLSKNILSGKDETYDLDQEFKDAMEPEDLSSDFIPSEAGND